MSKLSYNIDVKSLFQKSVPELDSDFSINLVNGYQGTGKTYFVIKKMESEKKKRVVYTNIKSYKSSIHDVRYFNKISDIYNNTEKHCFFLIDELSKKYVKNSPLDIKFYSWLQQSRKNQRHVYMITQEYIQVPQWLRGVAQTIYTTEKLKFIKLYKTSVGVPLLDSDTCEWTIDVYGWLIYKRTLNIAQKYDTFETINEL